VFGRGGSLCPQSENLSIACSRRVRAAGVAQADAYVTRVAEGVPSGTSTPRRARREPTRRRRGTDGRPTGNFGLAVRRLRSLARVVAELERALLDDHADALASSFRPCALASVPRPCTNLAGVRGRSICGDRALSPARQAVAAAQPRETHAFEKLRKDEQLG